MITSRRGLLPGTNLLIYTWRHVRLISSVGGSHDISVALVRHDVVGGVEVAKGTVRGRTVADRNEVYGNARGEAYSILHVQILRKYEEWLVHIILSDGQCAHRFDARGTRVVDTAVYLIVVPKWVRVIPWAKH